MKAKLELIDLGDAKRETKQFLWMPLVLDNTYVLGLLPNF